MNSQTTLSAKGQVVIPKDVRDRLNLSPGRVLDVIETPEGVLLKPRKKPGGRSPEEAFARIKAKVKYRGPSVSIEDMNESIAEMWASGGPKNW